MVEIRKAKPDMSGLAVKIRVSGFQDAKIWLNSMLHKGVLKCASCAKAARSIWWNDQAEWYAQCDDHRDEREQWTGSTRWGSNVLDVAVIPGVAEAWIAWIEQVLPLDREKIKLYNYDRTDWYALLADDYWQNETREWLRGGPEFGWEIIVKPLKDGQFAYDMQQVGPGVTICHGLFAPYETVAAAVQDARARLERSEL